MNLQRLIKLPKIEKVVDPGDLSQTLLKPGLIPEISKTDSKKVTPLRQELVDTVQLVDRTVERLTEYYTSLKEQVISEGFIGYADLVELSYPDLSSLVFDNQVPATYQVNLDHLRLAEREVYTKGSSKSPFLQQIKSYLVNAQTLQFVLRQAWQPIDDRTSVLVAGEKEPVYRYFLQQFRTLGNRYVNSAGIIDNLPTLNGSALTLFYNPLLNTKLNLYETGSPEADEQSKILDKRALAAAKVLESGMTQHVKDWENLSQTTRRLTDTIKTALLKYALTQTSLLIFDIVDDAEDFLNDITGLNLGGSADIVLSSFRPLMDKSLTNVVVSVQAWVDDLERQKKADNELLGAMWDNRLQYSQTKEYVSALYTFNKNA